MDGPCFQTFSDLNRLAEEGDPRHLDIGMHEFGHTLTSHDDWYAKLLNDDEVDEVMFCFGKAPGKTTGLKTN